MQIAKKTLPHHFIICILVVVNLYTSVNEETILKYCNHGNCEAVESVAQSEPYGLLHTPPVREISYAAVEPLDLQESQVKETKTSALMAFIMKGGCEDFTDSRSCFIGLSGNSIGLSGNSSVEVFLPPANAVPCSLKINISEEREEASAWTFVKPFSPGMWWAIATIMIYTSLVVCLLEQNINPLIYTEMSITEVFLLIWSAVSTMSLSQNVRIESRSARIVIAVWLLVMFIIVSSYADNFNSRINAEKGTRAMGETPKRLGVKDFMGWFIITLMVSTMALLIFFFNLLHASGAAREGTGPQLEMLPPNDDPEEQSSVEGETVQTMGIVISNTSEAEENTLVEASSVSILHTATESPSMEGQNV